MARFPQTEPEVAALAARIIQGLAAASADFPAPPVPPADLQAQLDQYNQILGAVMAAETALREQHAAKDAIYDRMQGSMRADLKYAELTAREQPEKLTNIGWGARREGGPVDVPGEARDLQVRSEGETCDPRRGPWSLPPSAREIEPGRCAGPVTDQAPNRS